MNRRQLLLGLGSAAAVTGGFLGTSAITSIETERITDIDVKGDSAAFVGLYDTSSGNFVDKTDGAVRIRLDDSHGGSGTGANHGSQNSDVATTTLNPAFSLHNQGPDTMYVQMSHTGNTGSGNDVQFIGLDDASHSTTSNADQTSSDVITATNNIAFIDRDGTTSVLAKMRSGGTDTAISEGGYVKIQSGEAIDVVFQLASDGTSTGDIISSATIEAYDDSSASGLYTTAVSTA